MNWKRLRSLAWATFKNTNFQSLCKLGKTWNYSQRHRLLSPNFESIDESGKVMSQFKFHCWTQDGDLHKAGNILNLTWLMRYSISSNFKSLSLNLEK